VPTGDKCTPKPGVWKCHTVVEGDTIESVAESSISTTRNQTALLDINSVVLYGSWRLYPGMELKIPTPFCEFWHPVSECYIVHGPHDVLQEIAAEYSTTETILRSMNSGTLGSSASLTVGMELSVPRREITLRPPIPCKLSDHWSCYTVVKGDTIDDIAYHAAASPDMIGKWNKLLNISNLQIGTVGTRLPHALKLTFHFPGTRAAHDKNYRLHTAAELLELSDRSR
jgi:hypothetical protein